jgi:hypothetical protein
VDGMQFSIHVGELNETQLASIHTEVLSDDQWYYDPIAQSFNVSWSGTSLIDHNGKVILEWNQADRFAELALKEFIVPEVYNVSEQGLEIRELKISGREEVLSESNEYHLFQNAPNPFIDGTDISFVLPQDDHVRLLIHDITGKLVYEHAADYKFGKHMVSVKGSEIGAPGIYYYTMQTSNASFTRKMTFTSN